MPTQLEIATDWAQVGHQVTQQFGVTTTETALRNRINQLIGEGGLSPLDATVGAINDQFVWGLSQDEQDRIRSLLSGSFDPTAGTFAQQADVSARRASPGIVESDQLTLGVDVLASGPNSLTAMLDEQGVEPEALYTHAGSPPIEGDGMGASDTGQQGTGVLAGLSPGLLVLAAVFLLGGS